MPMTTAAPLGREAIYAAGKAVNPRTPASTSQIRGAIPIARQAAMAIKNRSESTSWQIGDFTGLRIAIFQNWLYEQNRQWRFTDGTLAVLWSVEFPHARSDYAKHYDYIASTRTAYNSGRHQAPAPRTPSVAYDAGGSPVPR